MTEPYITKTGKVLTHEEIRRLSDEAEKGYDVTHLKVGPPIVLMELKRLREENEKLRAIIERALDCNDGGDAVHQILLDADALGGGS